MKNSQIFLASTSKDHKEFLNLVDLTAKVHGENLGPIKDSSQPLWDETFFHLKNTEVWSFFSPQEKMEVLLSLSNKILHEAYFIENAGMAYAAKMNLTARTKDERQFYCFVAEEEARHLRMIENMGDFPKSLDNVPSFALLIGEIIHSAMTSSHLLLIQILLEGWGLNYYKHLSKHATDENVCMVFKSIIKDEIRHHSAGIILLQQHESMSEDEIKVCLGFLERLAFMVKVGPYTLCEELHSRQKMTKEKLKQFLDETDAVSQTAGKMELIGQLISKSLSQEVLLRIQDLRILEPMYLDEMTNFLYESILKKT